MQFENRQYKYLNVLGLQFKLCRFEKIGIVDEVTLDEIHEILSANSTSKFVIDFCGMGYVKPQKAFFKMLHDKNILSQEIIFFAMPDGLFDDLNSELMKFKCQFKVQEENDAILSSYKIKSILLNSHYDDSSLFGQDIREHIIDLINKCSVKEDRRLSSTPFMTNYYFQIDKLFNKYNNSVGWLVSRFVYILRAVLSKSGDVKLVSSSLNGYALSVIIKEIVSDSHKIDCICFDRLGPDLFISEVGKTPSNHNECVYICDFIIGGTELKILKALLQVEKSKISHVIAIGKFINNESGEIDRVKVNSLFDMKQIRADINYWV